MAPKIKLLKSNLQRDVYNMLPSIFRRKKNLSSHLYMHRKILEYSKVASQVRG